MNKERYLLLMLLIAVLSCEKDASRVDLKPSITFETYFGTEGIERVGGIVQLEDSGYAIASNTLTLSSQGVGSHILFIRTDEYGNEVLSKTFGDDSNALPSSIANTIVKGTDNNIIVGGSIDSKPSLINLDQFGMVRWQNSLSVEEGFIKKMIVHDNFVISIGKINGKGFLAKADVNSGVVIWIKTFPVSFFQYTSLTRTTEGGYLVCGNVIEGGIKAAVAAFSAEGSFINANEYIERGGASSHDIITTMNGENLLCGTSDAGILLLEVDNEGDRVSGQISDLDNLVITYSITEATNGGYTVCGEYRPSAGFSQLFVAGFNKNRELIWDHQYGDEEANDEGTMVITTSDGGFAVLGTTEGRLENIYLLKLNSKGGL